MALAAGVGYLAAFLPPLELRRLQQRAVAFDLGQSLLAAPVDGDPDSVWIALARSARMITNGPAAVVALGDPPIVRVVAGEPPATLTVGATYAGPTPEQMDERAGAGVIAVPIESDLAQAGLADRLPGRRFALPRG